MRCIAIIPAGGKGKRSGHKVPKQYLKFKDKELIAFTLSVFQKNKNINEIIVPADPEFFDLLKEIKKRYRFTKLKGIVAGGAERQHSVYNALLSAAAGKDDLVAVHDAARPLLPQDVLTNAVVTAREKGNALVCVQGRDTLIRAGRKVDEYICRDGVYYVQTPQIFKYSRLMKAMRAAEKDGFLGTDESILMHRIGEKINLTEGSFLNFKITTQSDIKLFERLVQNQR